jgi:hypothetical protein
MHKSAAALTHFWHMLSVRVINRLSPVTVNPSHRLSSLLSHLKRFLLWVLGSHFLEQLVSQFGSFPIVHPGHVFNFGGQLDANLSRCAGFGSAISTHKFAIFR